MHNLDHLRTIKDDYILIPGRLLLSNGPRPGMAVLVQGGKFADIGPAPEIVARYPDIRAVDLPDHLLMPGFIDSHTHLTQSLGKSLVFGEPSEIFRRIWVPLEGSLNEHMVGLSARLSALESLRGGFTTAVDAGTRSAGHISQLVSASHQTGMRLVVGQICNDIGGAAVVPERAEILRTAEGHLSAYTGDDLVHPSLAISISEAATDGMLRDISQMSADAGVIFQIHVNEHLVAVERSLVENGRRPLEHLDHIGALGPQVLIAHSTLVTPHELQILKDSQTAVAYNPVASVWKGNAIAPAVQMASMGIRFGLGTDGTRADGFRLMDAAETLQRTGYGLASGDSSCGGGWLWLEAATVMAADVSGLSDVTGRIAKGLAADFLLVDLNRPEFTPSHDLTWELVRYGNRDQIEAVYTNGTLRLLHGWPVDWDANALMDEVRDLSAKAISNAPIQRVHPTADSILEQRET